MCSCGGFFFKQKTAYEMRISDWSSDVCSSDLVQRALMKELGLGVPSITWHSARDGLAEAVQLLALVMGSLAKIALDVSIMMTTELGEVAEQIGRASCRERVCQYV